MSGYCFMKSGSAGTMYWCPTSMRECTRKRAARHRLKLRDAVVRLRDLLEDLLDLLEIDLAGLGQRQLAAGAVEQAAADALLQRADVARHRGRRQPMLASGRRQAAVLHHAHEQAHRAQPFHPATSDLCTIAQRCSAAACACSNGSAERNRASMPRRFARDEKIPAWPPPISRCGCGWYRDSRQQSGRRHVAVGGYTSDLERGDVLGPVEYTMSPFVVREYCHAVELHQDFFQGAQGRDHAADAVHLDKLRLYRHACPHGTGPHARVHYRIRRDVPRRRCRSASGCASAARSPSATRSAGATTCIIDMELRRAVRRHAADHVSRHRDPRLQGKAARA